jgi:hypothetical protein
VTERREVDNAAESTEPVGEQEPPAQAVDVPNPTAPAVESPDASTQLLPVVKDEAATQLLPVVKAEPPKTPATTPSTAKTTPATTTPAKATPAKTTPAKATPAEPVAVAKSAPAESEPAPKPTPKTEQAEKKAEAPPVVPPDDSPTVVDLIPAFAIVDVDADATARLDAVTSRYRGARRRPSWTNYPIGAIGVAVVLLLITFTVAMQVFGGSPEHGAADAGEPLFRAQTPAPPMTYSPTPATSPVGPADTPGPTRIGGGPTQVVPVGPGGGRPSNTSASPSPGRSSAPPTSPPVQARTGSIVGIGGKCAEVQFSGQLQLNSCNGGSAQRWTVQPDGTVRAFGACLDVRNGSTANGTLVQLAECNRSAAQQWQWRGDGTLVNANANRCLDAEGGRSTNGTRLLIWDCRGRQNQVWRLV